MSPTPKSLQTAKLVLAAIGDIGGSASKDEIADHIETQFAVPNKDFSKHLTKAIERGIAFGAIKKQRGRYILGDVMEGVREHRRRRRSKSSGRSSRRRRRRRRR